MTFTKSKAKLELTTNEYAMVREIIENILDLEHGEYYDIGMCLCDLFLSNDVRDDIELSILPPSVK